MRDVVLVLAVDLVAGVSKLKSSVVKLVVTDRGGGCVRALTLMEEAAVVLADGCKGHLADLLIEDWGKAFKVHLKRVHSLILFNRPRAGPEERLLTHGPTHGTELRSCLSRQSSIVPVARLTFPIC